MEKCNHLNSAYRKGDMARHLFCHDCEKQIPLETIVSNILAEMKHESKKTKNAKNG